MDFSNSVAGRNITFVHPEYFIISGFVGIPNMKYYYVFLVFLYIISVLGNTAVMVVICLDHNLKTPKYVAVFNFAFVDFLGSSALVPKVIDIFLFNHYVISYNNCLTFLFFCYTCLAMQALNLVALAYDRVVAIVYPLHYQMKVSNRYMFALIATFWLISIIGMLILVGFLTRLSYCKSVVINSYFCDHGQIYRLSCNDNTLNRLIARLLTSFLLYVPLIIILCSYIWIGKAIANVATVKERVKAFKTCIAHLSLVAIYFIPIMMTFAMAENIHPNYRIINLSLASVIPPMLNPIIYVLQTQEIQVSMKRILKVRRQFKILAK